MLIHPHHARRVWRARLPLRRTQASMMVAHAHDFHRVWLRALVVQRRPASVLGEPRLRVRWLGRWHSFGLVDDLDALDAFADCVGAFTARSRASKSFLLAGRDASVAGHPMWLRLRSEGPGTSIGPQGPFTVDPPCVLVLEFMLCE